MAGDVIGSSLHHLEGKETPPNKGGRFCNLSECRRVSGVAMVATWSGSNAKDI